MTMVVERRTGSAMIAIGEILSKVQDGSHPSVQRLRDLTVLIVDEVSMMSKETLECLCQLLQEVKGRPSLPFGGV